MRQKLVTRAELAEVAGVSKPTISKLCKKRLLPAIVGKRIDAAHQSVTAYLESRGKAIHPLGKSAIKNTLPAQKKQPKIDDSSEDILEAHEDVDIYMDKTLREIVTKFGTVAVFNDWLKASKMIAEIHEKNLKNAQTKGNLIARRIVAVGVIDVINSAHLRLMGDGSKSIVGGVIAKHESGEKLELIESYASDLLGSFIKPIKAKIKRNLKNA